MPNGDPSENVTIRPMADGRTIHYYRSHTQSDQSRPVAQVITGGLGYIGQSLAYRLLTEGKTVVVIDRREIPSQIAGVHIVRGSVGDAEVWEWIRARYQIAVVFHCAGLISVSESVAEPSRYFQQNIVEGIRMLDHLRQDRPIPVVFSSSAGVYGTPERVPIEENTPKNPLSPYGTTKLQFEQILDSYFGAYQMPWMALRYFNAAGQLGPVQEAHVPETHALPRLARAIRDGAPPLVYGTDYPTPDGSAVRDYIHVADLVDAHVRAAQYLIDGGTPMALNLGSGTGTSVFELIAAFERVSGQSITPRLEDRRPGDPPILVAAIDQARHTLNWEPRHSNLDAMVGDAWNATEGGLSDA